VEIAPYIILAQFALFVALWAVLKRFWFDPALRIIHERKRRSEGAIVEARKIQAEVEQLRQEQAAVLAAARAEAQREMQETLRAAEAEQKRLIDEARAEAQRTVDDVRTRLAEDIANARRTLRDAAGEIARLVGAKVLGRPV
jgi:F-type H+-transporting ATPase subunit b